jgi:DNA-binding IclR family transcriptional regulator
MLGLLVRAPRSIAELSELTGTGRWALYPWLRLLHQEGLLRREKVGRFHVYHWSAPCK